jgi:hypothetical protein
MTTAIIGTGGIGSAIARQPEIVGPLTDKLVVGPSNPVGLDAQGSVIGLLPEGRSSGEVVNGWLPGEAQVNSGVWNPVGRALGVLQQPVPGTGGPPLRDQRRPCWRGSRSVDPNGRLRAVAGRWARSVGSSDLRHGWSDR